MSGDNALANVQTLYMIQMELQKYLEGGDHNNPDERKELRKKLREFDDLLAAADKQYMGGEDVFDSLVDLHDEVFEELKKASKVRGKLK